MMTGETRGVRAATHPRSLLATLVVLFSIVASQTLRYDDFIPQPLVHAGLAAAGALCALMTLLGVPGPRMVEWAQANLHRRTVRLLHRLMIWRGWHVGAGALICTVCWLRSLVLALASLGADESAQTAAAKITGSAVWATLGMYLLATWFLLIIPWRVRSRTWGS